MYLRAGFAIETRSADETAGLGVCAGLASPPGTLFCLRGDLGAGKTVFVGGMARGVLPPGAAQVTSPTYVLLHVHRGGGKALYHLDVYRLPKGGGEFEASGLCECLADPAGVVCIEWAERVEEALPADRVEVEIEHQAPGARLIHILATGPSSGKVVDELVRLAGNRARLRKAMDDLSREAGQVIADS